MLFLAKITFEFVLFLAKITFEFVHSCVYFILDEIYNFDMYIRKVFKRKIYNQILEWKNSPIQNSALLIEGARRIGKSTIVEEFARNEFPGNYIIVDFRKESDDFKTLFNNIKDLDNFYRQFFLSQNKVLKEGGLIVFDEVQFCPKAREAIKDFVNDGRYKFIETGSLISIKENTQNIMIPSEERRIDMFPMDFEEYFWAIESNNTLPLLKAYIDNHETIPQGIHELFLEKFRTYMLIGGMPKVLSIFIDTNSFKLANDEKLDILKLYRDDLRKHDDKYGTICGVIFDAIPSQLAKDNRRFVISSVEDKKRYKQIEKSLSDLCDFRIVNRVKYVNTLESPINLNVEEDKFKLYFCDTGLLISQLVKVSNENMNKVYFDFIRGKSSLNLGSIYESISVQQLLIKGINSFYHKFDILDKESGKNKTYELDLVVERDFKVSAIEIKSSKNYTTSSLDNIKNKYKQLKIKKYVFGIKNVKFEAEKATFPIYLILFIIF